MPARHADLRRRGWMRHAVPETKPTTEQYLDRIEFVRSLLVKRLPKHSIKKLVRQKFEVPELSHVAIETYLTRARDAIVGDVARGKALLRAESQSFYESILSDPKAAHRDQIKAQERIDKLLGLEEPTRNLHGNDPENPLPVPILRVVQSAKPADVTRNGHSDSHQSV